jgi:RNA recognition motif-containing protein
LLTTLIGLVARADSWTIKKRPIEGSFLLVSLFRGRFPSCKSAKIMTDAVTGQSRGYGFVRFSDETDQQRALVEMQGVFCGNRPMRISIATPKTRFVP